MFAQESGQDAIRDFQIGADLIQVDESYGYDNFAELQPFITNNPDGDAVVHLNGTIDQVTLFGINAADLQPSDFLFA